MTEPNVNFNVFGNMSEVHRRYVGSTSEVRSRLFEEPRPVQVNTMRVKLGL